MPAQRTLAVIKPDVTARPIVGAIISMAEEAGLRVTEARMLYASVETMEALYEEHRGRHYFDEQVAYMTSGPVLAMVLEGEDAIATWRRVMGPTDREKAPEGTVRHAYAETYRRNSVHGSDGEGSASREIPLFFS